MPKEIKIIAVGGINADNLTEYWQAGARGFGIGSDLYRAGDSALSVSEKTKNIVIAYENRHL